VHVGTHLRGQDTEYNIGPAAELLPRGGEVIGFCAWREGLLLRPDLLTPDPVAYCETNLPFGMQTAVNGWQVQYDQLLGDSYTNNWRCEYWVSAVVPTWLGGDGEEADFTLPPFAYSTPIDWNGMCNQQFPGSWAVWIPGPVTGAAGAPWACQAPPGVTYDPAEDANGVHAVLSS
jgi:hypothetical protein